MSLNKTDIQDVKLARPIAVVDLWDIDDRIIRLENCIERLEGIVQILIEHSHNERVRDLERMLSQALDRKEAKKQGKRFIRPVFNTDASEMDSEFNEEVLDR